MQKAKVFPQIIYYLCTFLLGIFLVFTMPYFFAADLVPVKVAEHLNNGEYREAMLPIAIAFNSDLTVEYHHEKGSVVVFETLTYGLDDEDEVDRSKVRSIYSGFLYGADGYEVSSEEDSQSKLSVLDVNGESHTAELYDNGYVYFELDQRDIPSIAQLQFVDKDGNPYLTVEGLNLSYSESFFADVAPLVTLYNSNNATKDELAALQSEFTAKSDSYTIGSDAEVKKIADTRSAIIIVVYFVCVYVVADFLLGYHYILRFFRWFIFDVCKAKPQQRKAKANNEIFGRDYYSQVTVSLDLSALPDFNESVQVKYTNTDAEVLFILLKENNYTATERIKAGTYVNPFIDINREYAPVDLPDNLEVEGYRMNVKIKIIRREV